MALLGVNIDHVATVRNARGGDYPDPVRAALIAEENGADGITAHLREDRRHILDDDMRRLKTSIKTRLNMEMANTPEMVDFACEIQPYMVTLVPEKRQELTTEGGLDVVQYLDALTRSTEKLKEAGILVSLFIDPDIEQLEASKLTGATIVEFHTGRYCELFNEYEKNIHHPKVQEELDSLILIAEKAVEMGIEVNAGHGLNRENVAPILKMPGLNELNIGHRIVADRIFMGFADAVKEMKGLIS